MVKRSRNKGKARASKGRLPQKRPIATRIARQLDRFLAEKVVDLSAVRDGRRMAQQLRDNGPDAEGLAKLHPAHAVYVFVLNELAVLTEALSQLPALDRISDIVTRAEDTYMPEGPPMSPLTRSYFNSWVMFDCGVGIERETLGTVVLALSQRLRMDPELVAILAKWQASRMGLYEVQRSTAAGVELRELVTEQTVEAHNPTGYDGRAGAVWYVRVLPPPAPPLEQHIILTTPYEVQLPGVRGWLAYLERTLPKTRVSEPRQAYESLMKWGLAHDYWHEYVSEAYAGHQHDVVRLMGLPDIPESRPHSAINEEDGAPLRDYLLSGLMETGTPPSPASR